MDNAKFCPGCGTRRQQEWRFCAECGASIDGTPATTGRRNPTVSLAVFCGLVLAGVGLWIWILQPTERSGPPGSPTLPTGAGSMGNAAVAGAPGATPGAALPDGHPPVERPTLPDDVKQFIATLADETERTPKSVEAWTRLAEVQYRAARIDPSYYEAALNSYRHLQEIDPDNADALRGLANVHYDKQQYVSARPYFEQYLELRPDDHAARTDMATVRMHLGEVDEAIAIYREIIAANPTFVQAHYNLGVALHRTGDDQGATDAFRHAREISTDDRVRARIDLILGQLGAPEPEQDMQATAVAEGGGAPAADGADGAPRTPFQRSVETFFRTHQIVGPKLVAVEWGAPTEATVKVRDFPMTAMPPFAREKFTSRIRAALGEAKEAGGISGAVSVAITDDTTGTVMETVQE